MWPNRGILSMIADHSLIVLPKQMNNSEPENIVWQKLRDFFLVSKKQCSLNLFCFSALFHPPKIYDAWNILTSVALTSRIRYRNVVETRKQRAIRRTLSDRWTASPFMITAVVAGSSSFSFSLTSSGGDRMYRWSLSQERCLPAAPSAPLCGCSLETDTSLRVSALPVFRACPSSH